MLRNISTVLGEVLVSRSMSTKDPRLTPPPSRASRSRLPVENIPLGCGIGEGSLGLSIVSFWGTAGGSIEKRPFSREKSPLFNGTRNPLNLFTVNDLEVLPSISPEDNVTIPSTR